MRKTIFAQNVLNEMKEVGFTGNQSATAFIAQIEMAANHRVELDECQGNFLHGLIATHISNNADIIAAATVATWINSCRLNHPN